MSKQVRVEIDAELSRDLERLARVLGKAKGELIDERLREAIASDIVELEQRAAANAAKFWWWRKNCA